MSARKRVVKSKEDRPSKKPTAAQMNRAAIRARCNDEAGGKCQRCGSPKGSRLLSLALCFQFVFAKCCGAHAAAMRAAKAESKKKQIALFGEPS